MTEIRARRASVWKIMAVVAAILALALGVPVLWIRSVADRRWAQMEKDLRALHEECRARERPRLTRGDRISGNAWDDYNQAIAVMDKDRKAFRDVDEYAGRGAKADREKTLAVVNAHLAALDFLHRGARRERGEYPARWEDGASMKIPGLFQSQRIANYAVCRARFLAEEGKSREAMELMLDTCQLGHDIGSNTVLISEMISIAIHTLAFDELRDLIKSGKMTREELLDLERALEEVEGTFPRNADSMMNEPLMCGYEFAKMGSALGMLEHPVSLWSLWRYGFSSRLCMADCFDQYLSLMRRAAEADAKPWAEANPAIRRLQKEAEESRNPIVRVAIPSILGANRTGRQRRTTLRQLRIAAHYRATGEVLDLDDPMGTKMLHSVDGGRLKIWGAGWNTVLEVDR